MEELNEFELTEEDPLSFLVAATAAGQRLDKFLSQVEGGGEISRSQYGDLIRTGQVQVNGCGRKASYKVQVADLVTVVLPAPALLPLVPEDLFYLTLYEDQDVVVLSKPPGLVVHPACGHQSGTLVHGLLYHCRDLAGIGGEVRPGIVHRLDMDTSGIMVVAKNDAAHHGLVAQFKERRVKKIYRALVDGVFPNASGRISLPIGRHPRNRKKMAVSEKNGREAVTHWQVLENFGTSFSYLQVKLDTGRTHQIRVHMAACGHPIAGDGVYGRSKRLANGLLIPRQCLHAFQLSFFHPRRGEYLEFEAPLWPDMATILEALRAGEEAGRK